MVSPEFENGASFNTSALNSLRYNNIERGQYPDTGARVPGTQFRHVLEQDVVVPPTEASDGLLLATLQVKAQQNQLDRKIPHECIEVYKPQLQQHYRNVLVVTEFTQPRNSAFWLEKSSPENTDSNGWTCMYTLNGRNMTTFEPVCGPNEAQKNPSTWSVGYFEAYVDDGVGMLTSYPISYCLVEPHSRATCSLHTIPSLFIAVIIANAVKLGAMMVVLSFRQPTMVTIGDGLASFLEAPDPTTKGMCLADEDDFDERKQVNRKPWDPQARTYKYERACRRWFATSTSTEWCPTLTL